jgi:hypothetical protein
VGKRFDVLDQLTMRVVLQINSVKLFSRLNSFFYGLPANNQRAFFRTMLLAEIFHSPKIGVVLK